MKATLFFLLNTFVCVSIWANNFDIESAKKKLHGLVNKESEISLSVANAMPNQRITKLMLEIDKIGQQLMKQEQNDEIIALSEKCLAILAVLRERRIFAYMLWAEGRLEKSTVGRYEKLSDIDQHTLMVLYGKLSEINISVIRENMLNREIMGRLAEIYDCLKPENKKKARENAIFQQRDALTNISNIPRRKTLDDF